MPAVRTGVEPRSSTVFRRPSRAFFRPFRIIACGSFDARRWILFTLDASRARGRVLPSRGLFLILPPRPFVLPHRRCGAFGAAEEAPVRAFEELHARWRVSPEDGDQAGHGGEDHRDGARAKARHGEAHVGGRQRGHAPAGHRGRLRDHLREERDRGGEGRCERTVREPGRVLRPSERVRLLQGRIPRGLRRPRTGRPPRVAVRQGATSRPAHRGQTLARDAHGEPQAGPRGGVSRR
mmetsp:Transcript_4307/g.19419  ORF Transcript_4307/g.19419 Transcript_4307/m.19419 type:complete len:237 (-) Transcript_4307:4530-5240(-)